jgi:hypothetical protein
MATIKLNDQFGLDETVQLADRSALLQYAQELPALLMTGANISKIGGLTLDQPAVLALQTGLSFSDPVALGADTQLTIDAGVHGSFAIARGGSLFSPDAFGDNIAIPADSCYVSTAIDANVAAGPVIAAGNLTFGANAGGTLEFANYRRFPAAGTPLLDALKESIGGFVIPATPEALDAVPTNGVVTATGTGSLKLSVTANLFAATNPLAALTLPAPLPAVKLSAGGSVQAGATFTLTGQYQIRAQKLENGRIRLGWYRKQSEALTVSATLSEGIAADVGGTDLFSLVLGAISGDPKADIAELKNEDLNAAQIQSIQAAVQAAVQRKLEVAVSAQIGALQSGQAAFLYEIDMAATTPESREQIARALGGDLTPLHADLAGVQAIRSIWRAVQQSSLTLKVNLLGIYNFISIAKLTSMGATLFEPSTGAVVITDKTTAERIRSQQVNFGADSDKLRAVLAESFLITAVYHGGQSVIGAPALQCTHSFFTLDRDADFEKMRHLARTGVALGLVSSDEAAPPASAGDFGRATLYIEAQYDQALASTLFSSTDSTVYDNIGRTAVQLLVGPGDEDSARRIPASDDVLWKKMRTLGDAQDILALFPSLPEPLKHAIFADYLTIVWWSDAMAGAAQRLQAMQQFLADHPGTPPTDPEFQKRRAALADHIRSVAANTREEFGQPWGLVAMNELSGRKAAITFLLANSKFGIVKNTRQEAVAAGGSAD